MASPLQLSNILSYSAQFNFPLTADEIWYWQISSRLSLGTIKTHLHKSSLKNRKSYYYLPGRQKSVSLRINREHLSRPKWAHAHSLVKSLRLLPTIQAIFVTGALAMNNCPADDDIDIMLITSPHSLWLTRLLVVLFLGSRRRPASLPEHASPRVANKICDNLYLDTQALTISRHDLYTAHEVLQAKCIFDRSGIARRFLEHNSWVGDYLPIAYHQSLNNLPPPSTANWKLKPENFLLFPLNLICFIVQYLYMKPKISHEHISLHSAFFHPRPPPSLVG